jgi:hypothetical protein
MRALPSVALLLGLGSATLLACAARQQSPGTVAFPNADFAQGLSGWTIAPADKGMSSVAKDQLPPNKAASLKITDTSETDGSDITSPRLPVKGNATYELRWQVFPAAGTGLGVYVRILDKDGKVIGSPNDTFRQVPSEPKNKWVPVSLSLYMPDNAAFIEVWVHSYAKAQVTAYLGDFSLLDLGNVPQTSPWPGTYKIKPTEKDKLTNADIAGPDGIVYPDWRYAGIPGGNPKVAVKAKADAYGAKPDDDKDDSDAIERGLNDVGKKGGGALLLAPGTYHLDRPIQCTQNGVVLRGAGADKTHFIFRYAAPPSGVGFFRPLPNDTVNGSTWIEVHAKPKDLRKISIETEGKQIGGTGVYRPQHWGGTFSARITGSAALKAVGPGTHKLKAIAEYADGSKITSEVPVTLSNDAPTTPPHVPIQIAAIMFSGNSQPGPERKLAKDAKRGDRTLTLEPGHGIVAGDRIRLRAPATERWNKLVKNACQWGEYRRYEFVVEGVDGNTVRLNQPLRLDFPTIDNSNVQKITPLRNCGVEDFSLEQTHEIWTSGIVFSNIWESWARGVTVKKAGRFPLYFLQAKWNEVRDCTMDDAWYKGGGGTAYVGWEHGCDNLMENVQTNGMRHAPCVQWGASGNVIRNSTFINSDGQWHSGWTNENLFENCTIKLEEMGTGAYGYGLWASPPEDDAHGPNGPRNVVYNCDIAAPKSGIWMGGSNEAWLILYNRFKVGSGPGISAKTGSFDHIIKGNVFTLAGDNQPLLALATPDCVGVEITNNLVVGGSGKLVGGPARPALTDANTFRPAGSDAPRPAPTVPSIFAWQRQNKPLPAAKETK